jgi:PAS domain S-box-containing protein
MTVRSGVFQASRCGRGTRTARVAGCCVAAVGLLVLAGWGLDIAILKGPFPGLVQMKADTAIGFIALGMAVVFTTGEPSVSRRHVARALASVAILIGAITLSEYVLDRNLGVDQLLFRDLSGVHTSDPGRLAPQTAINFVLLGFALVLLANERAKSWLVGPLTGISFVIALFAVIGYAYGVSSLAEIPSLTPIALHTAVTFIVLCVGIAARNPNGVFVEVLTSDGPGSVVARRLLPVAVVLLPVFGWLTLQGHRHGLYPATSDLALLVLVAAVMLALAILSLTRKVNRLELAREVSAASAARLGVLVEASNEAIISADLDGTIITWNRAAATFYGYTEQEIIGQSVSVLSPPDRVAAQQQLLGAVARGDASTEFDAEGVHKDGSRLNVSVAVSPIIDAGELRGFCAVTHDITERLRAQDQLEAMVRDRTHDLARSRAETLQRLARAAEYRDDDTAQHTERVGAMAARLARSLGLPNRLITLIGQAAPLHDVGKIAIPDRILLKPAKLTEDEFDVMRQHTTLGATLLAGSSSEILQLAEQIALTHHERWDGSGYPAGLAGEQIPIAGRIVAVVDSFDAMTHDRPYRTASPIQDALGELLRCRSSQFDPEVVDAFLKPPPARRTEHATTSIQSSIHELPTTANAKPRSVAPTR